MSLPTDPPSWTAGPSRPTENPAKPVKIPPIYLEIKVRPGFMSKRPTISPSI